MYVWINLSVCRRNNIRVKWSIFTKFGSSFTSLVATSPSTLLNSALPKTPPRPCWCCKWQEIREDYTGMPFALWFLIICSFLAQKFLRGTDIHTDMVITRAYFCLCKPLGHSSLSYGIYPYLKVIDVWLGVHFAFTASSFTNILASFFLNNFPIPVQLNVNK